MTEFRVWCLPSGELRPCEISAHSRLLHRFARRMLGVFTAGRILNPKFSQYRVPRTSDLPKIEVVLLDRKDVAPAGAGETPIMATAPAIGNAIFDAAGVRLRSLPMAPQGLKV